MGISYMYERLFKLHNLFSLRFPLVQMQNASAIRSAADSQNLEIKSNAYVIGRCSSHLSKSWECKDDEWS